MVTAGWSILGVQVHRLSHQAVVDGCGWGTALSSSTCCPTTKHVSAEEFFHEEPPTPTPQLDLWGQIPCHGVEVLVVVPIANGPEKGCDPCGRLSEARPNLQCTLCGVLCTLCECSLL